MKITAVKWKPNFLNEVLSFVTSDQIHSLLYIICKVWYACKVLFNFLLYGKFANIRFAIVESHVHIKENPKASTRCDGQSLSFHLYQNAGYLFTCWLPLDKNCNIKNGVY